MDDGDSDNTKGQSIDEVNSEITEIIKLERFMGTAEELCANTVEQIKKYSRALYSLADRDGVDLKTDETIKEVNELLVEYKNIPIEEVLSSPEYLDGRHVHLMTISNDEKTRKIVGDELYTHVYDAMERQIFVRRLIKLSKISNALSLLLSPEIDLHKNLTVNIETQDDFEEGMFDEQKTN